MTRAALLRLVRVSLRRNRRAAWSSVFGVSVGVAALVFFVALGLGVARVVREKVFPVDASLVEVVPAALNLGLLGGGQLDEEAVARLAALPGVKATHRKMTVRVPAVSVYDGDFFGRRLRMGIEVVAVGVDASLVQRDVALGDFVDPGEGKPLPVIVASRLLEVYNKTFAPARSLPQISGQMIVGFSFPVTFNRSYVAATPPGPQTQASVQVVGVSDRGLLAGLTIPLESARRINRASNADAATYSAVTLEAAAPDAVPALAAAVRDMGFRVDDSERRQAENAGAAVAVTTSALALLSLLICLLAAFNIAHALSASVRARERELAVMRAVGASRADIRRLVQVEAAALGLLGGGTGTLMAVAAALSADMLSTSVLPDFPFKPDTFFTLHPALLLGGVALGALAAVAGAYFPARRASAIDPARALAGQAGG